MPPFPPASPSSPSRRMHDRRNEPPPTSYRPAPGTPAYLTGTTLSPIPDANSSSAYASSPSFPVDGSITPLESLLPTTSSMAGSSGMQRGHSSVLDPKLSPAMENKPFFVSAGGGSGLMQRSGSNAGAAAGGRGGGHLRRRSSTSNLQTSLLLGEEPPALPTGVERASSLTTFMNSGGRVTEKEKRASSIGREKHHPPVPRVHRRRLYTSLTRLMGLVTLTLLVLYLLKQTVSLFLFPSPRSAAPDAPAAPWLAGKGGALLFDTLAIVPYPLSTHPRTPPAGQHLPFSEYLTTRLGSHFSFPSANVPGRVSGSGVASTRGSQLWLMTATNRSVAVSARHLSAFVRTLDERSAPLAQFQRQGDYFHSTANASRTTGGARDLENVDQRGAQRILVVLCRDKGCVDYCRQDEGMYCFGGFARGQKLDGARKGKSAHSLQGLEAENGDEVAKLRAISEALESGRRVFWVDDGVYFRSDPAPYMGDLSSYDLQIPNTWSSGYINAGFQFVNPTQRTISFFHKLLTIALLPSESDRLTWGSTNLLLDPSGQQRDAHHQPPQHADALDENIFAMDGEEEAPAEGRTSTGRSNSRARGMEGSTLARSSFDFKERKGVDALYWHCACCGDEYTNDYIAGALGFH
ncbi:hypothetical protein JCM10213v2_005376 [Rhodosporidiobolus nylandii]